MMKQGLKANVGLSAIAVALGCWTPAQAQAAPASGDTNPASVSSAGTQDSSANAEGNPDEIVVTGFRKSLQNAVAIKRDSAVISDVISADDIGNFPDRNLAESLQRVTGVQITRNRGEGSKISVRGLSPDFTSTQYNGRMIPTTDGGRGFSFASLGSDFVTSVSVQKSPTADMIDGGISATVDVRVARPLDVGRDRVSITAEGIYETNPKKVTPHVSVFVNKTFADDTIGINLGGAIEKRRWTQIAYTAFGSETRFENAQNSSIPNRSLDYNMNGQIDVPTTANPNNGRYAFNHATTTANDEGSFLRRTLVGGIQVKPVDGLELYADGFYSKLTQKWTRFEHQLRFTNIGNADPNNPTARILSSTVGPNVAPNNVPLLTSLSAVGVDHRGDAGVNRLRDTLFSGAFGAKYATDRLEVSGEITYSKAKRANFNMTYGMISRATASYDLSDGIGEIPNLAFGAGYDPLDDSTFNITGISGRYNSPNVNRNYDGKIDLKYEMDGFVKSLKIGGYIGNNRNSFEARAVSFNARTLANALGIPFQPGIESGSISADGLLKKVDYSGYFIDPVLAVYLVPDSAKILDKIGLEKLLAAAPVLKQPSLNYIVTEKNVGAYARLDFGSGDERLSGNIGLRYVRTTEDVDGATPDLATAIITNSGIQTLIPNSKAVSVSNTYDEWLPSLNLSYKLNDQITARFAAARTLTRPTLSLLTPAQTINANVRTITAGNPFLKPYTSDQLDLSFEYYLDGGGLISLAGFYKEIKNYVANQASTATYSLEVDDGDPTTVNRRESYDYRVTTPVNLTKIKVKGIELGAQIPFNFLPGALDGLGFMGNVTYLDAGKAPASEGGPLLPLTGVSKWSYSVGGYYEKGGFGLHANYNYRSRYVESVTANFGDGTFASPYGQLDISASYDINDRIAISFDVSNALSAKLKYTNSYGLLRQMIGMGTRYTSGIRVNF